MARNIIKLYKGVRVEQNDVLTYKNQVLHKLLLSSTTIFITSKSNLRSYKAHADWTCSILTY